MFLRRPSRPAGRRPEAGFTLVELVVTISILGFVVFALFGVVFGYLKVSANANSRLTEGTDQQFASAFWQSDVSALGSRNTFDPASTNPVPPSQSVWLGERPPGGCGNGVGAAVVAFTWTEFKVGNDENTAWNTTAQEVAYVVVGPDANGQFVLKRVRCRNGVADPSINVAHSLTVAPTVQCQPGCNPPGGLPERVSLTLTVRNLDDPRSVGYTSILAADRRQG